MELMQQLATSVDFAEAKSVEEWLKLKVESFGPVQPEISLIQQYLAALMSLIDQVGQFLTSQTDDTPMSVSNRQICTKAVEFLIGFGMAPSYEKGVGVPMDRRLPTQLQMILRAEGLSVEQKIFRLKDCCSCLQRLFNCKIYWSIVGSKFLADVLAGLLQLNFSKQMGLAKVSNLSQSDRNEIRSALDSLLKMTFRPVLIREVLVLQTGVVKTDPPPVWLRSECGRLLSQCLLESDGFMQVIRGILDFSGPSGSNSLEKAESIAKIISTCPHQSQSPLDYYRNIGGQIVKQLRTEKSSNSAVNTVLSCCVRRLSKVSLSGLDDNFPLNLLNSVLNDLLNGKTEIHRRENDFNGLIDSLHVVFCAVPLTDVNFVRIFLLPTVEPLLKMFLTIRNSTCYSLGSIKDLLVVYLSSLDATNAAELLIHFCKFDNIPGSNHLDSSTISFKIGDDNGVTIDDCANIVEQNTFDRIDGVMDLLSCAGLSVAEGIATALLTECLREIADFTATPETLGLATTSRDSASLLVNIERDLERHNEVLVSLTLLETVVERFYDTLVQQADVGKILDLCQVMLNSICRSSENAEMISLVFGIVGTLLLCFKEKILSSHLTELAKLRESMLDVSQSHNVETVRLTAAKLLQSVDEIVGNGDAEKSSQQENVQKSPLAKCIEEIGDSSPPVKGHGLIILTRLAQAKDKETLERLDEIICLLTEALDDEDSYVFLNAINCLVAVGQIRTKSVLPVLLNRFLGSDSCSTPEQQMKIGEILTKMISSLGEMAPLYTPRMVDVFLALYSNTSESEIKASSLANIGEVFKANPLYVQKNIAEVLLCITHCLKFEREEIVRRAAAQIITQLMSGLTVASFESIGDSLLQLYRLLKQLYTEDPDEIVRLHSQLALEQLDEFMRSNMISRDFHALKL